MSPRETIRFTHPPRAILLAMKPAGFDPAEQLRAASQAGYERGLVDGEHALSEQLLRQRAELLALHQGAVSALEQAVPQVVRQTEDAMIALAFEIAQKLVADLPITRELVAAAVREALTQVEDTAEFKVVLHPDDLELLGADPAHGLGGETSGKKMRFSSSRDVSRGGCLVQTRFGTIDTRRETKLAQIAKNLGLP